MNEEASETLDKTIIYINSDDVNLFDANTFTFSVDLLEPIRDVVYIKIMKSEIIVNPTSTINGNTITDTDPIFVTLNNYKRISTVISGNNTKFFDQININLSEKFPSMVLPNTFIAFKNESSSSYNSGDPNLFILNPMESNLKKLNFALYDKKNVIVNKNDIKRFNTTLCVYHTRRKISRT